MEDETTEQAGSLGQPTAAAAQVPATEPKADLDTNPVSKGPPNLRFPVPAFFTDDPDLWFFQLEATFIVNRVTTEDKYAVVVANLPYSVVRRIPRTLASETSPYTILKELVV